MFKNEEYSSFLNIFTKIEFTILLIYKFYILTPCLFAGTDKERLCVSKIRSTKHTAFPRSQSISILLFTKSQGNEKIKPTSHEKYMKYFINVLKTLNLMLYTMSFTKHSRFSAVQRSRVPVMTHVIFFVIHR